MKWIKVLIACLVIAFFVFGIRSLYEHTNEEIVVEYELSDFGNGIYAYKQMNTSNAPAHNYTITTICTVDGSEVVVKGKCHIHYTENEVPRAIITMTNFTNADSIELYVPKGSIERLETSSSGRK